jgi:hypothetical protein
MPEALARRRPERFARINADLDLRAVQRKLPLFVVPSS